MQIRINKPCKENLANMQPNSEGFFCSQCAKNVIDFSKKSDREIIDFLDQKTEENLCGFFSKTQINRPLAYDYSPTWKERALEEYLYFSKKPKKNIFQLIYIFILYAFLSLSSCKINDYALNPSYYKVQAIQKQGEQQNKFATVGEIEVASGATCEGGRPQLKKIYSKALEERFKNIHKIYPISLKLIINEKGKVIDVVFLSPLSNKYKKYIKAFSLEKVPLFSPAHDARGKRLKYEFVFEIKN